MNIKPIRSRHGEIKINADIAPYGYIKVRVLSDLGALLDEKLLKQTCVNHTSFTRNVDWPQDLRFQFELMNAKLFSIVLTN